VSFIASVFFEICTINCLNQIKLDIGTVLALVSHRAWHSIPSLELKIRKGVANGSFSVVGVSVLRYLIDRRASYLKESLLQLCKHFCFVTRHNLK